jgi:hypothetical protein
MRIFVARGGVVAELRRDADGEFPKTLLRVCGRRSFGCLPDRTNVKPGEPI